MLKLHELQESRAAAVTEMRALDDKATTEKRDLTADEVTKFGALKTTISDLDAKIGRAQTLADAERSAPAIVHGRLGDGQYETRARDFSITKAMRAMLPRDLGGGDVDVGFEKEISSEVARRSDRKFEGLAVPDQVFMVEKRTWLTGSTAAALVQETHRPDLWIDLLRSKLVAASLGATYLSDLVGAPIDIPRQTGSGTAQWLAEDASLTEADATADDVQFIPKTVGAMTSYSRRTLLNASPAIEQIVRNDLAAVIANAIDNKAMMGDGTTNTPKGIVNVTGVNTVSIAATPTLAKLLAFISQVDAANALGGSLGWALNPFVVALLRRTQKMASTDSRTLMDDPSALQGYPAVSTTGLPGNTTGPVAGAMIFGNWADLMIGSWTGIDILLNPYDSTAYPKGRVVVRALKDLDIQVRHAKSFTVCTDATV
jgi:HK97 family phage major capsid protein